MSRPDTRESPFAMLPGKKAESSTVLELGAMSLCDRSRLFSGLCLDSGPEPFFGVGLAGEGGSDRDDVRPSVAGAGSGGEAKREVEGLRDRLGGSCGIRDRHGPDSDRTGDAKLHDAVAAVAV
jgi:hypothetical protein